MSTLAMTTADFSVFSSPLLMGKKKKSYKTVLWNMLSTKMLCLIVCASYDKQTSRVTAVNYQSEDLFHNSLSAREENGKGLKQKQ